MIKYQIDARIVKICSIGLTFHNLGKSIHELRDHFHQLNYKFSFNVCGEGGEYESAVFDCPLFKTHKLVSKNEETIVHDNNEICRVAYLRFNEIVLQEKSEAEI
jgi:diphthine-ammonia ligase